MGYPLEQKYKISPNKTLGQNFLRDKNALKKVLDAAELSPSDIILEIGPGTGILTERLAQKARKVVAIEKDKGMVNILKAVPEKFKNVEIIYGDALKIIAGHGLSIKDYKVVANIPYYLTSNLIRKLLESGCQPKLIVLMIQKEVAERIVAKPPDMNLLAVSVQFYATAKIISYVSKKSFWPVPKVDSAIIKITPKNLGDRKKIDTDKFFKIIRAGFAQPRKQLLNNLSNGLRINKEKITELLLKNKIDPIRRAETLTIQDWLNICNSF